MIQPILRPAVIETAPELDCYLYEQHRALRKYRPGRRSSRQVPGLGVGTTGATRRRGRAWTDRWLMPQHCLPAQQELDPQREGGGPRSPCRHIRDAPWPLDRGYGRRAATQARDGRWLDRDPPGAVCGRGFG